jgi:hypothetical protein
LNTGYLKTHRIEKRKIMFEEKFGNFGTTVKEQIWIVGIQEKMLKA